MAKPGTSSSRFLYAPPRLRVARPYELTHGARVDAFARGHGKRLMRWQLDVANDWGAVDERMQFVHRRCGGSIPRQVGKSDVAVEWAAYLAAELGYGVLYTAHNYDTTCEMLRRFREIFGRRANDPAARHRRYNRMVLRCENSTAQEAIFFKSGGFICFSTRTKTAKLGFSFDVIFYDEAQDLTTEQMQAIAATTTSGSHDNPQEVYLGTPHRPGSAGNVFGPMRAEAHGEPDDDLSWWEWGIAELGDITDESRWYEVNPSLADGVANVSSLRMNCRKFSKLGDEGVLAFAQEFLGYWLPGNQSEPSVIGAAAWNALATGSPPTEGRAVLAFKFSPDGSEGVVAACRRPRGGTPHVECVAIRSMAGGLQWFVDYAAARAGRYCGFVVDGGGNAQEMCDRLLAARVPRGAIVRPSTAQVCSACAGLLSDVADGRFTHFGQPDLDRAATSVKKRQIGKSGFGFEGIGGSDPLPVEAVALALWGIDEIKRDPNRKAVVRC